MKTGPRGKLIDAWSEAETHYLHPLSFAFTKDPNFKVSEDGSGIPCTTAICSVTCKRGQHKSWQLFQSPRYLASVWVISCEGTSSSQLTFSIPSTQHLTFCKQIDCTWSCANILGWIEESEDNSWAVSGSKDSPLWLDSALVTTDSPAELPTVPQRRSSYDKFLLPV